MSEALFVLFVVMGFIALWGIVTVLLSELIDWHMTDEKEERDEQGR